MYSEFYTACSGMAARLDQMDLLANNLANVNTVGFKVDEIILEEEPVSSSPDWGRFSSHVRPVTRWIDFAPGTIQTTGRALDLALEGEDFFMVQTADGPRLTRDGRFSLDKDGLLMLGDNPVVGVNGEIYLTQDPIKVRENGTIVQGGGEVARIRVVRVSSPQNLERVGEGLFRIPPDEGSLQDVAEPEIRQGCVEMSNANAVKLMVEMIDAVRSFELHQRVITTLDKLAERAIQGLARTA